MPPLVEAVYAGPEEEFFYTEDDSPVSEGNLVGFDLQEGSETRFLLTKDVYWNPSAVYGEH